MRLATVTRTATAVTAALVAAALLFGAAARRRAVPPAADARARAFAAHCGACHEARALARRLGARSDDALLAFLDAHGDAPADVDRAIVAYLRREAAGRATRPPPSGRSPESSGTPATGTRRSPG
jgi:mono/diheme cytochrome c family protein